MPLCSYVEITSGEIAMLPTVVIAPVVIAMLIAMLQKKVMAKGAIFFGQPRILHL